MTELKISEEILNSAWYRDMMADADEPEQWVAGRHGSERLLLRSDLVRKPTDSANTQDTPERLAS